MNQKKHCKSGFTLSDVLVALVIIGIIAALTVPAIMNNTNKQELRSAFKKSVSGINRALLLHYSLTELSAHDYTSADLLVSEIFEKRMNVIHLQEGDENKDTSFTSEICDGKVFILNDGMIYCISNFMSDYNDEKGSVCDFHNTTPCTASDGPNLWIDVNGERKPNTLTTSHMKPKDIYSAQIYSQKVIVYGSEAQKVFFERTYADNED